MPENQAQSIDDMIAQANAAAAGVANQGLPAQTGGAVTIIEGSATNVAPARAPAGAAMTLDDMDSGSLSVDVWLKLSEHGFTIGDNSTMFDEIKVGIIAENLNPHRSVRCTVGTDTKYFRSTDGQTEARTGRPWGDVVAECMRRDEKCTGDYVTTDIPLIAMEQLVCKKTKAVLVEVGQLIGTTIPMTGVKYFTPFRKNVLQRNPRDAVMVGKITHLRLEKGTNKWGVIDFGPSTNWAIKADA